MTSATLIQASASHLPLADESVQCVVTSPPYWGLRQYAGEQSEVWGDAPGCTHEWADVERKGGGGQTDGVRWQHTGDGPSGHPAVASAFCPCGAWYGALGLEPTPELYVEHMVAVFREVRRVLRADGTLWLNLGDSYATGGGRVGEAPGGGKQGEAWRLRGLMTTPNRMPIPGLKPKDLVGIPWMVAFALRADGWYLRSDIIWHKPNPMPESVTDRPTKAHEYLFLLTKSERYFYDAGAIREPTQGMERKQVPARRSRATDHHKSMPTAERNGIRPKTDKQRGHSRRHAGFNDRWDEMSKDEQGALGRNKRTVWTIPTRPYPGAHFATFPEQLVEPCILAGSKRGDVVLDPFNGSGTTGRVAIKHGRSYVGVDISREYLVEQSKDRINNIQHTLGLEAAS